MDVLRLVLVDDYRMVTEALASRLSAAPDLWVAGCCQTDDPRLPEVVRWLRPDVVLIDVEPLGFAIPEVLSRISEAWPDASIIVVSADGDVSHAVEAARAGADAWVSKSQGADQLETVLRGVARGHSWFPPEMLGEILRGLRDDVRSARESTSLLDTLSPRELDVLTSMAKGKRARQIAAELMISADTVRTHTRSIFGKLEVHSRIEAVSVAWAAGLRPEEAAAPAAARAASGGGRARPPGGPPGAGTRAAVRAARPGPGSGAGSQHLSPATSGRGGSSHQHSSDEDSGLGDPEPGDPEHGDPEHGDAEPGDSGDGHAGRERSGRPRPGPAGSAGRERGSRARAARPGTTGAGGGTGAGRGLPGHGASVSAMVPGQPGGRGQESAAAYRPAARGAAAGGPVPAGSADSVTAGPMAPDAGVTGVVASPDDGGPAASGRPAGGPGASLWAETGGRPITAARLAAARLAAARLAAARPSRRG
jgi:two-component system nitrate/nitrite response regulator NarL